MPSDLYRDTPVDKHKDIAPPEQLNKTAPIHLLGYVVSIDKHCQGRISRWLACTCMDASHDNKNKDVKQMFSRATRTGTQCVTKAFNATQRRRIQCVTVSVPGTQRGTHPL